MSDNFVFESLSSRHDRNAFACGVEPLDRYLKTQVGQDIRRHLTNCFVAVRQGENIVVGYYTLAASSVPLSDLPDSYAHGLPHYPHIPVTLLGRLAVDREVAGQSLGSMLVHDARSRVLTAAQASFALVADVKEGNALTFYQRLGFLPLSNSPLRLMLPMRPIKQSSEAR